MWGYYWTIKTTQTMRTILISVFLCICVFARYSDAADFTQSNNLYSDLTTGHNKNIRPHANSATATDVSIEFYIMNLKEINEVDGTVSMTGYFNLVWDDQTLQWTSGDPANVYGSLDELVMPHGDVWKPPLINSNSAKDMKLFGISDMFVHVSRLNTGTGRVSWMPGENLEFTCDIDATYFPFDTQECTLDVMAWGYGVSEVTFTATTATVQTTSYATNGEWDLIETSATASNTGTNAMMKFKFKFKRRPLFLVATLVAPIVFLAMLNIAVFFLPHESGERIGYSITLLLAVVVFLTIAQAILPSNSVPRLSDFCILLAIDLGMSGMIMINIIITSRIYNKPDDEPVPDWAKGMVGTKNNKVSSSDEDDLPEKKFPLGIYSDNENRAKRATWADVASIVDTVSAIIYILLFIGGNLFYILDIVLNSNY